MVKFLNSLPQIFKERYLETHEKYLKSIADVTAHLYGDGRWKEKCNNMLLKLVSAGDLGERKKDVNHETLHFKNLRNCWYHECALNYPLERLDDRLRFAAWKIIQCYYAVFSSIASLVRCFHVDRKSHDAILNIYAREFLCHRRRKNFFLPPVNFYLNQQGRFSEEFSKMVNWNYADSYHIPNIKECLEAVRKERQMASIPHYLKTLREWVSYEDAYLFFRLYGELPKKYLDFSLKNIAFIHCAQTEFFLIQLFGWDAVKLQYGTFSNQLKTNLGINSPTLAARFSAYSQKLKN